MRNCTKLGKEVDMFKNNCNDSSSTSSLLEVSEDRNLQDCTKPHFYIILQISLLPPFDPLRILLPSIHRNSLGVGCSARVLLHRPHLSPEDQIFISFMSILSSYFSHAYLIPISSPRPPYPWRTDERKLSSAGLPCAQQEEPPAKLSRRQPEDTQILKFGNCQSQTNVEREER